MSMSVNHNWLAKDREELETILHLQFRSCILHVDLQVSYTWNNKLSRMRLTPWKTLDQQEEDKTMVAGD